MTALERGEQERNVDFYEVLNGGDKKEFSLSKRRGSTESSRHYFIPKKRRQRRLWESITGGEKGKRGVCTERSGGKKGKLQPGQKKLPTA